MHRYAFEEDERTGDILFWTDTAASLKRLLIALAISALIGVALGRRHRRDPLRSRDASGALRRGVSLIPPLALLPILFIVAGLGELAKVLLIIIGVAPVIVRDLALRVAELPPEQIIKAQTLGASTWQLMLRVVLPQTLAAANRCPAPDARIRVAVPHRCRGYRLDRRTWAIASFWCAAISRWM